MENINFDWNPFQAIINDYRKGLITKRRMTELWSKEQERQMYLHDFVKYR